jgi:hypothetical protein
MPKQSRPRASHAIEALRRILLGCPVYIVIGREKVGGLQGPSLLDGLFLAFKINICV